MPWRATATTWACGGLLQGFCALALLAAAPSPSSTPTTAVEPDTDGDGLPDAWEQAYGFDESSDAGVDGALGDPDLDGLNNLAEYQILVTTGRALNPRNADTRGTGLSDFFDWASTGSNRFRIFGAAYTDFDGQGDAWEASMMLDPRVFDAHCDGDADGWRNRSEFLGGVDPTSLATNGLGNPADAAATPVPEVLFMVSYGGTLDAGPLRVLAYHAATMDGAPDAAVTVTNLTGAHPRSLTIRTWDSGRLREGDAWFFAYYDANTNGAWNAGEPAGLAPARPSRIAWGRVGPVLLELSDSQPNASQPGYALPGYARVAWPPQDGALTYHIIIRSASLPGKPNVLNRTIAAPRAWLYEVDFQNSGVNGLPQGAYEWLAYHVVNGSDQLITSSTFTVTYPPTLTAPVLVTADSHVFTTAGIDLSWSGASGASRVSVQVAGSADFGAKIIDATFLAPYPDQNGRFVYRLPVRAGDAQLPPGTYYWRARGLNPQTTGAWSVARAFRVDLTDQPDGPYSISGSLFYFGKATNGQFVVQAFAGPGFAPESEAQITLPNTADAAHWPGNAFAFRLAGLSNGTHCVRAFLDQDGDRVADDWETAGFVRTNHYFPMPLSVPTSISNSVLTLSPADTDGDVLGDDWEYQHFANLTTAGAGPVDGYTDSNGDGVNDFEAYAFTGFAHDPRNPDAAGEDGIPFRVKTAFGLDPLAPMAFALSGVTIDGSGRPGVAWQALPGGDAVVGNWGSATQSQAGTAVGYHVQRSHGMSGWSDLATGDVAYVSASNRFLCLDPAGIGTNDFYRLRVTWSP
ncbi:MAG: hypothetical protein K8T26_09330 [Lentisphaerae bacterium]|nr:hypothetical protein [Lentisphaerota bacterium]